MTHMSLFTGIGGLDLAAESVGITTVGQCEIDPFCRKILDLRFPGIPKWGDIRGFGANEFYAATGSRTVDVLSGGFPCQPHSLAGKRRASADERDLWGEYRRVIRELEPRWVVAENVRGLLSSEHGRFFGGILRDLDELGYHAAWCSFRAADVGAIHSRERVAIVAYSGKIRREASRIRTCDLPKKGLQCSGKPICLPDAALLHSYKLLPYGGAAGADDGVPDRMDRFGCIGNAVVPQQFAVVFRAIVDIEEGLR